MDNERDNEFSRESDSHNITRRDALKIISGTIGVFTFSALVGSKFNDAFGVSGVSDDYNEDDINQGDGLEAGHGREYVWFDEGGFYGVNRPASSRKPPTQGWGKESIKYFEGLMLAEMKKLPLAATYPFTGIRTNKKRHSIAGKQYTDRAYYYKVAQDAIDNCIAAETENARLGGYQYSGKARVVGVAWNWQRDDAVSTTWYQFIGLKNSTFEAMFPRAPKPEETHDYYKLPDGTVKSYWEDNHNDLNFAPMNWRQYVYANSKKNATRNDYQLIVIAVADGVPIPTGSLTVKKEYDGGDSAREFKFRVTFSGSYAPKNPVQEFTLHAGESHTITELRHGVDYVVEELTGGYEVIWTPSNKGSINVYDTQEVVLTCENKSGFLELIKDVTD